MAGRLMPRAPAVREPHDIIEFITGKDFLADESISVAQVAIVKAFYGLKMTGAEEAAFLAMHEGRPARSTGYDEMSLGAGRRGGKEEKISSPILLYECLKLDPRDLAPGETAWGILIAENEKQARILRDYIEAKIRILESKGHRLLEETEAQSKPVTAEAIRLRNRVSIACFPCRKAPVRGFTAVAVGLTEIAHWQVQEGAYNADRDILRAVRPSRMTLRVKGYKVPLIKSSTPFAEVGVFYNDWRSRHQTRQLVLHEIPTKFLNPRITDEELAREQFEDPESFDREFLAKWGAAGDHKPFGREMVEACTDHGRIAVPPKAGNDYVARIDAAFKRDTFPLGIAHREGERVVVDLIHSWKPAGPKRPLDDKVVVAEIVEILRPYGIGTVIGDQFCDVPLKTEFARHGIGFIERAVTEASKYQEYTNLASAMRGKLVSLPDQEDIRADLTGLIKSGKSIGAPKLRNRHDDISTVIRGLVFDLLPSLSNVDLEALNRGAVNDVDRLFRERGFPLPDREDRLPTNIMSEVY
jgi:hypothetical protein